MRLRPRFFLRSLALHKFYLYLYCISYRKQIARQLRTQYVEGIYNNPVTLKSRLRVILFFFIIFLLSFGK